MSGESDEVVALQLPNSIVASSHRAGNPHLIKLRRETVPVYRKGKVASFKTSYSGLLGIGSPRQEFRVVFDTGSGHVVLPAVECKSESCLVHRRYNMKASATSTPINMDGSPVKPGELCDQATIGFGTGSIKGEFVKDRVCVGASDDAVNNSAAASGLCMDMHSVVAVEMTTRPFKSFNFDGIFGLGLGSLALSEEFSAFGVMSKQLETPCFGAFLTEGENGDKDSEMALGGYNPQHLLEPLSWIDVANPEQGYWQVAIKAVRLGGVELDVCKDGSCRGVVDTGTSHLGVPAPFDAELAQMLTRDAGDLLDCRLTEAPELQIELSGVNLTLHPHNYMRRLPLREDVTVSSSIGVHVPGNNSDIEKAAAAPPVVPSVGDASSAAQVSAPEEAVGHERVQRFCRPRMMPVRLPPPLGPKLFILGEPLLHRYYTAYDWAGKQVGFGLSNTRQNTMPLSELFGERGSLPADVDMLLMQTQATVTSPAANRHMPIAKRGNVEKHSY